MSRDQEFQALDKILLGLNLGEITQDITKTNQFLSLLLFHFAHVLSSIAENYITYPGVPTNLNPATLM